MLILAHSYESLVKKGDPGLLKKIAAGLLSGGVGSMIANPTDLVKVRCWYSIVELIVT
jgi:hypothetical protein